MRLPKLENAVGKANACPIFLARVQSRLWQALESISSPLAGLLNGLISPSWQLYHPSPPVSSFQCSFIHPIRKPVPANELTLPSPPIALFCRFSTLFGG